MTVEITVITVCRNDAENLRKTLNSCTSQSVKPNVVIVDGASTDNTSEIVATFEGKLSLTYSSEPDTGIFHAMNKGVLKAPSDHYLWFLNAGDEFWDQDSVRHVSDVLSKEDAIWIAGRFCSVNDEGRCVYSPRLRPHSLLRQAYWRSFVCHQAVLVKRSEIIALGLFDDSLRYAADYKLLLRLTQRAKPLLTDQYLARFLNGGISQRNYLESINEQTVVRREVLELSNPGLLLDRCYAVLRTTWFRTHLRSTNKAETSSSG